MKNKFWVVAPVALSVAMALSVAEAAKKSQEEDSVYRWGRWEVLEPAAGSQPVANLPQQISLLSTDDFEKKLDPTPTPGPTPEPGPEPIPVQEVCQAGTACGFATRNAGREQTTGEGAVLNTFALRVFGNDGAEAYEFTLNDGEEDQLDSAHMDDVIGFRTRQATDGDDTSGIVMNVYDDPAKGFWNNNGGTYGDESGFFAWGTSSTQATLDGLNAGNVTANFNGPMASGATFVDMTVMFGTDPSWQANWSGAHNFGASGDVVGASLIATQITDAEGTVKGFLTGDAESLGAITAVDVMTGSGQYTDVGYIPRSYATPN